MSYYDLNLRKQVMLAEKGVIISLKILKMVNDREIGLMVFHEGFMEVVCLMTLKKLMKGRFMNNGVNVENIIGVENFGMDFIVQTFDQLYYFRVKEEMFEEEQKEQYKTISVSKLLYSEQQTTLTKFWNESTNRQITLIKIHQKLYLKLCGNRLSSLIYFVLQIKNQQKLIKQFSYAQQLQNQYRISLNTFDRDIIIYQSYANKFKPTKVKILHLFDSKQAIDCEKYDSLVYQYQQRFTVNNAYKIGEQVICLIGNDSFEKQQCSCILLHNFVHNNTVNNIRIPNTILIHTHLTNSLNLQRFNYGQRSLWLQCMGMNGDKAEMYMIWPLCSEWYHHQIDWIRNIQLMKCDIGEKKICFFQERGANLSVMSKIDKKCIYMTMLTERFRDFQFAFSTVLAFLQ